jgi:hypothetical protein
MSEDQKNAGKGFPGFCAGMPLGDMMRKMMETKKSGAPFNCTEMMSRMMQLCCPPTEKKKEPTQETQKNTAYHR